MNRYVWVVLLLLVGCNSRSHMHERRATIRASHQEAGYHTGEGFQSTRWGMTRDQVLASYPQAHATPRGDLAFSTVLAERPAWVLFLFSKGQLVAVFVRFTAPGNIREDYAEMVDLLTSKYGRPWRRGGTRRVQKHRESIDLAWLLAKLSTSVTSQSPGTKEPSSLDVAAQPQAAEAQPPLGPTQGSGANEEQDIDSDELSDSTETSEQEPLAKLDNAPEPGGRIARDGRVVVANWHAPATEVSLFGYWTPREKLLTLRYESAAYADELRDEMAGLLATQRRERAKDL